MTDGSGEEDVMMEMGMGDNQTIKKNLQFGFNFLRFCFDCLRGL